MTRSAAVTSFLGLVLAASFVFASIEFRRMSESIAKLDEHIKSPETAAHTESGGNAGPVADTRGEKGGSSPAASNDVVAEIGKLREEIRSLREGTPARDPGQPGGPSVANGGPTMSKEDYSRAIQDALVAKEKADKEKQARAYKKQLAVSAKSWAESLSKTLGLTEQQKNSLAEIFADEWGKMNTAWTDSQDNENAEPVDYNKVQKETTERVHLVLTADQANKYDEMMKKNNWGAWGASSDESTDDASKDK